MGPPRPVFRKVPSPRVGAGVFRKGHKSNAPSPEARRSRASDLRLGLNPNAQRAAPCVANVASLAVACRALAL